MQLDVPLVRGEPIPILYVQMDGTGVPVVKKEMLGRPGKTAGQPAHTWEVKLGCVFTQTTWDGEGYAIRDPDSTTYVGAIETAEEFGQRLYLEAWKRGWSRAQKRVGMGDGSEWIWNQAQAHFPKATQIVDVYHAPTSVGVGSQAPPQRGGQPEPMDPGASRSAGGGQDRRSAVRSPLYCDIEWRTHGENPHRSGIL